MPAPFEIRADFDRETIVVYQAFSPNLAGPALANQKFVAPFSFTRMTWIKPSFLWLMEQEASGAPQDREPGSGSGFWFWVLASAPPPSTASESPGASCARGVWARRRASSARRPAIGPGLRGPRGLWMVPSARTRARGGPVLARRRGACARDLADLNNLASEA